MADADAKSIVRKHMKAIEDITNDYDKTDEEKTQ